LEIGDLEIGDLEIGDLQEDTMKSKSLVTTARILLPLAAIVCFGSLAFAEIPVQDPRVNGRPVDWCLVPTQQCGKPAADRYCQMQNMGHAVSFRGQRSNERTIILGTRELCDLRRFDHCDRFSLIVCSAVRID